MSMFRRAIKPAVMAVGRRAVGWDRDFRAIGAGAAEPARAVEGSAAVRRLLLWSMNSLGDVLRATPAIRLLREHFADAQITMVAAGRAAPILRHNPCLDALVEIPDAFCLRQHRTALRQLRGNDPWDLAVLLEVNAHWSLLEGLYLRWLGVPRWVCFDFGKGAPKSALGVPLGESGSWIDQFNRLASAATGGSATTTHAARDMEIHLLPLERESASADLSRAGIGRGQPFILVHPGGNALEVSRRWSAESFAAVINDLWDRYRHPFVLTGTQPERPIVDAVRRLVPSAFIAALCGTLTMRTLAAVIERASLCIVNDTGPLHVAHALRRPTVAILGPTDPQVVGVPATTRIARVQLPCSPCARFAGWTPCTNPVRHECLARVTPAMVLDAATELLDPSPRRLPVLTPSMLACAAGGAS